jgi:hypothetical protein
MADGLQTKWATTIGELLRGGKSLKEGLKDIFDAIVTQFTDMIGAMIAEWVTNFIGGVLTSTKSAASDIVDTVTGAASTALSGGLSNIIGGALGGVISGLIGGGGGPSTTDSWHFEHIWRNVKETRDWHFINHQARLNEITKVLTGVIPVRQGITNKLLRKSLVFLKSIDRGIGNIPGGQHGLDFQSGSRGGLVRYHANERITVSPNVNVNPNLNIQSAPVNIYLDGRKVAESVAKFVPKLGAQGRWKTHTRGLTDRR